MVELIQCALERENFLLSICIEIDLLCHRGIVRSTRPHLASHADDPAAHGLGKNPMSRTMGEARRPSLEGLAQPGKTGPGIQSWALSRSTSSVLDPTDSRDSDK